MRALRHADVKSSAANRAPRPWIGIAAAEGDTTPTPRAMPGRARVGAVELIGTVNDSATAMGVVMIVIGWGAVRPGAPRLRADGD